MMKGRWPDRRKAPTRIHFPVFHVRQIGHIGGSADYRINLVNQGTRMLPVFRRLRWCRSDNQAGQDQHRLVGYGFRFRNRCRGQRWGFSHHRCYRMVAHPMPIPGAKHVGNADLTFMPA